MANKPTSPMDTTGRAVEEAQKREADRKAKEAAAAEAARQEEVFSLENDVFDPKAPEAPILIDEVEEMGVSVNNDYVIIRTVSDIENMTFGVINGTPQTYNFKANVKSRVPRKVAEYLSSLGYTYTV